MGLMTYMHLMEYTHTVETLHFLSSLRPITDLTTEGMTGIRFKIHGIRYRLRIEDICHIYGFERFTLGEDDMGTTPGMMDLWHRTASGDYHLGKTKASHIRNPAIKLAQRCLGFAFFGRHVTGPLITEEWKMVCSALRPLITELEPPVRPIPAIDPVIEFITHLFHMQDIARAKKAPSWPLCIGGTLTPIFRHCGVELTEPIPSIPLIDMRHLRNSFFLSRSTSDALTYPFTWGGRDQELTLPRPDLVDLHVPANILFTHILDDSEQDESDDDQDDTPPDHDEAPDHGTPGPVTHDLHTSMERLAKENGFLKGLVKTLCKTVRTLKGRVRSLERHSGHTSRTYQSEARTKRRHDRTTTPPLSPSYDITTPPVSDPDSDSA